ncbi:hypothetical protein LSCM4_00341 [Leishmania orientalis]|uniref:adenylate cyclase n=1 Tax=Leishmania orientalis TaxID=2249476 RepID=A0A836GGK4_9TRYP|nr:hypothetical protein LSCM4_00341 [Leishmania orientalis]
MLQPPQLAMRFCNGDSSHPPAVLLLLLLLVLCAPVSANRDAECNAFDIGCILLQTSGGSSTGLKAADATARKASITCSQKILTHPSAWAPTDGLANELNVYMSMLSDTLLSSVVAASSSTSCTLVASTSEGVLDTRGMSGHVYFTNADPATEMLGLLSYAMTRGAPPKIGFVYASKATGGTSAGATVYKEFLRRIRELAYTGTVIPYDASQAYDAKVFAKFASSFSTGTSVIFFFPPAGSETDAMCAQLLASSSTNRILMPSWLIPTATTQYLAAKSPSVPSRNVIVSSTNPHPQDPNFVTSMSQFARDYGSTAPVLAPSSAEGIEAVAGWITAQATVATLQPHTLWTASPTQKSYFNGLFQQRFHTIGGEIFLGAYSKSCNVGGRMVILYSLTKMNGETANAYYGLNPIPNANLMMKPWECHAADVTLSTSKMVLAAYARYHGLGDNFNYMTTQMQNTIPSAMLSAAFTSVTIGPLQSAASTDWKAALDKSPAIAVFGASTAGASSSQVSQVLLEPVFMQPTLYQNLSNVVYLTTTNEQQLGAMAAWVAQSAAVPDVHAVLRSSGASVTDMQSTLQRIAAHAGATVRSVKQLDADATLSSSDLPTSSLVLLTGVIHSDIATLKEHLQDNSEARVLLLFDEVTQWYGHIQATFTPEVTSFGERLLFVTNLPPWVPKDEPTSTLSASFLDVVLGPDFYSPASMRSYVAVRALSIISDNAKSPTSGGLVDALYTQSTLQVDDLTLGAFQRTGCAYSATNKQVECTGVINGGGGKTYLWSYSDMLRRAGGPIAGPYDVDLFGYLEATTEGGGSSSTTTTKAPKRHAESTLKRTTIIISALCFFAAAVIAAAIIYASCSGNSRENRHAPKDDSEPVTLIFTDIESSTALWATAPQAMAFAVTLHHKLTRQLIIKYKCYEVKTIGDSFMIACKEPFTAVQLARDLQAALHQADWGSTSIDDAYELLGSHRSSTGPEERKVSPWRGLRVRAGIHRGLVEVRFDEVTKGYDYYGSVVNIAARTESISCGGQVICTSSVVEALTTEEHESVELLGLGPHQLRGIAEPVEMYELRTIPGRVFPSKASGVSANPLESTVTGNGTGSVPGPREDNPMLKDETSTEKSASFKPVAEVLDVYFSAYTSEQKIKFLRKTCKFLSLSNAPRRMFTSNEAYAQSLLLTVATRTSAVIDFRHRMQEANEAVAVPEIESIAVALDVESNRDAAVESLRQSTVFFGDVESPVAGKIKRRRSMASGASEEQLCSQENSASTMVLVMDNGDLLTLQSGTGLCCAETPPEEAIEAKTVYLNGAPSLSGDEASACFQEGNGLLFRIIDKQFKRWAFYNDTTDYAMVVHFSIGRNSAVEWGPSVTGRVTQAEGTGRYEGELVVLPLATEVLMTGCVSGYRMRYTATALSGEE